MDEHEHAHGDAQLRREANARADVGEAIAIRPVERVIRGAHGRRDAERDRIDPRAEETAKRAGDRTVRLEVERALGRSLADLRDGVLDLARGEERLALARTAEREDRSPGGDALDRGARDLATGPMERRALGGLRLAVAMRRERARRALVRWRRDRERALPSAEERIRRTAAAVIARAARELSDETVAGLCAEPCGDASRDIGSCERRCVMRGIAVDLDGGDD